MNVRPTLTTLDDNEDALFFRNTDLCLARLYRTPIVLYCKNKQNSCPSLDFLFGKGFVLH